MWQGRGRLSGGLKGHESGAPTLSLCLSVSLSHPATYGPHAIELEVEQQAFKHTNQRR